MSHYEYQGKNPNHQVLLGWDPPLCTFFLHVIDTTKDEDDEGRDVVWIGCTYRELNDLDAFMHEVKKYVVPTVSSRIELIDKLLKDSD